MTDRHRPDRTSAPPAPTPGSRAVLARGDRGYPERLAALPDPPDELRVRGRLDDRARVALVGSREADPALARLAERLAGDLAGRGMGVVSGGARGIDTAAHEGALAAGGETIAVLGAGIDRPYPAANRALFDRIAASGAVVSELPDAAPPTRWTFPRRNRIIAALARAVVVVQAGDRSGALITADVARRIGVPVGAVPGPPNDPRTRGCNGLIRGGATLVEDVRDVLGMIDGGGRDGQLGLQGVATRGKETPPEPPADLGDEERAVLEALGAVPVHIDDIASRAGLTAPAASAAILNLELAGLVEGRGGKLFVRTE